MKKISLFLLISIALLSGACKEDNYQDWKIMNANWLDAHLDSLSAAGFSTAPSGLMYKIIEPGYQRHPNEGSVVEVKYTGKLIDNSVFDSQDNSVFYLSQLIYGWREGLKMLQDGGRIELVIPYELGYGTEGSAAIPPYSVLRFDVRLVRSMY
jgi:FKBP-type peptidyl-prolyl cis-trans isomerase